jgi:hypothetical protein
MVLTDDQAAPPWAPRPVAAEGRRPLTASGGSLQQPVDRRDLVADLYAHGVRHGISSRNRAQIASLGRGCSHALQRDLR